MGEGIKALFIVVDVTQKPFIRAVKVTGVYVAVTLCNKLVHTVAAHTALLCGIAQIQMHKVVKVSYTCVVTLHIVLNIAVEGVYQKVLVLIGRHIKLAFGFVTKGTQAGDELQIFKITLFKKTQDFINVICTFAC